MAAADAADDDLNGGAGTDTLDYSAATASVKVDLAGGVATGSSTGVDQIAGFEIVEAGSGDDTLAGSAEGEVLKGNAGTT